MHKAEYSLNCIFSSTYPLRFLIIFFVTLAYVNAFNCVIFFTLSIDILNRIIVNIAAACGEMRFS